MQGQELYRCVFTRSAHAGFLFCSGAVEASADFARAVYRINVKLERRQCKNIKAQIGLL